MRIVFSVGKHVRKDKKKYSKLNALTSVVGAASAQSWVEHQQRRKKTFSIRKKALGRKAKDFTTNAQQILQKATTFCQKEKLFAKKEKALSIPKIA